MKPPKLDAHGLPSTAYVKVVGGLVMLALAAVIGALVWIGLTLGALVQR